MEEKNESVGNCVLELFISEQKYLIYYTRRGSSEALHLRFIRFVEVHETYWRARFSTATSIRPSKYEETKPISSD